MRRHASVEFHRRLREYHRAVRALAEYDARTSADEVDVEQLRRAVIEKEAQLDAFVASAEETPDWRIAGYEVLKRFLRSDEFDGLPADWIITESEEFDKIVRLASSRLPREGR